MPFEIVTHPVYGFEDKGHCLSNIPHYYLPGLNTHSLSTINNSQEAVQYYSVPDRFDLPQPYVPFSEIESSNNIVPI